MSIPKALVKEIERWQEEKKFGNLQINFSEGRIVNVNRTESIKIIQLVETPNSITISAIQNGTTDNLQV